MGTKLRDIGIGVLTRGAGLVLVGVGFNRCRAMEAENPIWQAHI